jgi:hypothetical protein
MLHNSTHTFTYATFSSFFPFSHLTGHLFNSLYTLIPVTLLFHSSSNPFTRHYCHSLHSAVVLSILLIHSFVCLCSFPDHSFQLLFICSILPTHSFYSLWWFLLHVLHTNGCRSPITVIHIIQNNYMPSKNLTKSPTILQSIWFLKGWSSLNIFAIYRQQIFVGLMVGYCRLCVYVLRPVTLWFSAYLFLTKATLGSVLKSTSVWECESS